MHPKGVGIDLAGGAAGNFIECIVGHGADDYALGKLSAGIAAADTTATAVTDFSEPPPAII